MRSTPTVATLLRLTAVYSVFGLPYLTLIPVYARDVLGLGASGYGTLLSCVGVGAIAGALFLAAVGRRVRRGRLLAFAATAFAALLIVLSFVRTSELAAAVLLLCGLTMILTNAITNGLLQTTAPDEFRGRVMSVHALLFIGMSPAGAIISGAIARWLGVDAAIGIGASIVLGFALFSLVRHPEVRRL